MPLDRAKLITYKKVLKPIIEDDVIEILLLPKNRLKIVFSKLKNCLLF